MEYSSKEFKKNKKPRLYRYLENKIKKKNFFFIFNGKMITLNLSNLIIKKIKTCGKTL